MVSLQFQQFFRQRDLWVSVDYSIVFKLRDHVKWRSDQLTFVAEDDALLLSFTLLNPCLPSVYDTVFFAVCACQGNDLAQVDVDPIRYGSRSYACLVASILPKLGRGDVGGA
jgi:hypothetical protein